MQSLGTFLDRVNVHTQILQRLYARFELTDLRITRWMARHGVWCLRVSLGLVAFWFGLLKFFPGLSPAHSLATDTIREITFGQISPDVSILILAAWECLVGLGLMLGVFMRLILLLLFLQMFGTLMPLFLFPDRVFTHAPYAATLEGQYIIKNFVLISAGIVVGATVRGGRVVADPEIARLADDEELIKGH